MARTFEQRIESLTRVDITSSSIPSEDEVTQILAEGIKDLTNKIPLVRPDETFKFATESTVDNETGIEILGNILSVVRANSSTTDFRPASQISAQLRYLSTDVSSLHYRSKFNPAFYLLNKKLYVVPTPDTSNEAIVSHINYATANYDDTSISNFPDEYEDLVILYSCAMICNLSANNIQNNLPTKPVAPISPDFTDKDVKIPDTPVFEI